jgi:hypothetical protein
VKGWRKPSGSVCVTYQSRYANPFRPAPGRIGDLAAHAEAKAKYLEWITSPGQAGRLERACRDLRGRDLGCTCAPHLPCHADVLLELVNGPAVEHGRAVPAWNVL